MATRRRKIKNRTRKNKKFRKGGMDPSFPADMGSVLKQANDLEKKRKIMNEVNEHTKAREMKRKGEMPANNPPKKVYTRFNKYENEMKYKPNYSSNNESNNY